MCCVYVLCVQNIHSVFAVFKIQSLCFQTRHETNCWRQENSPKYLCWLWPESTRDCVKKATADPWCDSLNWNTFLLVHQRALLSFLLHSALHCSGRFPRPRCFFSTGRVLHLYHSSRCCLCKRHLLPLLTHSSLLPLWRQPRLTLHITLLPMVMCVLLGVFLCVLQYVCIYVVTMGVSDDGV